MKRHLAALGVLLPCIVIAPAPARAVPKLNIKIFVGVGSTTFVDRLPRLPLPELGIEIGGRSADTLFSWQGGVTARIRSRKVFGETGLVFSRFGFEISQAARTLSIFENPENPEAWIPEAWVGETGRMNSFDIPMIAGYVPYGNPLFKLYLYGGVVHKFNIRGFVETEGRRRGARFSPKEAGFVIYQAGFRLGTAVDVGPFNFDFNYTIGINSFTREYRTNSHVSELNVGWLF